MSNKQVERSSLSRSQKKAILAATIGNVVEWYDFALYGLLASVIATQLFPPGEDLTGLMQAFSLFALSFFIRPLGAWMFGRIGDRQGRSRALAAAIIMMGAATLFIALIPTYQTIGIWSVVLLLACRLLQGLSAGGEWAGASTLLVEYAGPGRRGFFGSFAQIGATGGSLLGSLIGAAIGLLASDELLSLGLWRILFAFGGVIAIVGLYIRLKLEDTPEFLSAQQEKSETAELPATIRPPFSVQLRLGLIAVGFTMAYTLSIYMALTYMPTYVTSTTGTTLTLALEVNVLQLVVLLICLPIFGSLSDRIGRRPLLILFCAGCLVIPTPAFLLVQVGSLWAIILGQCLFAVLVAIVGAVAPAAMAELFPTEIRYTAFGVAYNLAVALFGGTAPLVATWLISTTGNEISPAFYLGVAGVVSGLTVIFAMPESAHQPLKRYVSNTEEK